ncbi:MAG: NACHT domain-containing protein [Verrucomicrobiia bacterium]
MKRRIEVACPLCYTARHDRGAAQQACALSDMSILEKAAEKVINSLVDSLPSILGRRPSIENSIREGIQEHIGRHLRWAQNWSSHVQSLGAPRPSSTDSSTIPLMISDMPRRYRAVGTKAVLSEEKALLAKGGHFFILGGPGSGKTTTMKRLTRSLLTTEPASPRDVFQFPVVILFRECNHKLTFCRNLAHVLGIPYREIPIPKPLGGIRRPSHNPDGSKGLSCDAVSTPSSEMRAVVGETPLEHFLAELFDSLKAVLLLDGYDELPAEAMASFGNEILTLSRSIDEAKIIVTCRSGEATERFEGFSMLEICPLSPTQSYNLARHWLGDPTAFFRALDGVPYKDLVDRPLLLAQLVFLFSREGSIPDQPSLVYRKVVRLLLRDWDDERGIRRESAYARFDPEIKADFLSELSYLLTYRIKAKRFSESNLLDCYRTASKSFNLPEEAGESIVREIESHTGVIVSSGYGHYEFSHLSLQEYLCANYLVRAGFADHLALYIREYPVPVAVAVALSADPSNWLGGLILREPLYKCFDADSMSRFLARLLVEHPYFKPEHSVGCAILRILGDFWFEGQPRFHDLLSRAVELPGVTEALAGTLSYAYVIEMQTDARPDALRISRRFHLLNERQLETPGGGLLPKSIVFSVLKAQGKIMLCRDSAGLLHEARLQDNELRPISLGESERDGSAFQQEGI